MPDYSRGKIYKIYCPTVENSKCYIGSTTKPLISMRFSDHKSSYKNPKTACTVYSLFDEYGVDNCIIELIEEYNATSKDDLFRRESFYIKSIDCVNFIKNTILTPRTQKANKKISDAKKWLRQREDEEILQKLHEKNAKRVKCPECNEEFSYASLPAHIKFIHKKESREMCSCPECGKEMLRTNLGKHFKRFHE